MSKLTSVLIVDTNKKVKVKTCSQFDTSSWSSSDDEKDMPYDVLLQNSHLISCQCNNYKENYKIYVCENTELKKSNKDLKINSRLWKRV